MGMTIGAIIGAVVIGGFGIQQIAASDDGATVVDQQRANDDNHLILNEETNNTAGEANETEQRERTERQQTENNFQSKVISVEKVEEIALNEFDGTITEFELDEDDGRFIYEMEMRNKFEEAEIEIDGQTGEILELDIENDEDDDDDDDRDDD